MRAGAIVAMRTRPELEKTWISEESESVSVLSICRIASAVDTDTADSPSQALEERVCAFI